MSNFYYRFLLLFALVLPTHLSWGQGVTTSSLTGVISGPDGEGLPGATVVAVHTPSGTQYGTATQVDGRYVIPNMRVGGPYTVKASYVSYQTRAVENVSLSLGTAATVNITLAPATQQLGEVEIVSDRNDVFSRDRTGASTNITRETINTLPTISRSINDFTRLTPQASGRSFGGQDNRFNNITVDGSVLNSAFGLSDQPGGRTGSTPISLDAIEEIQVNLAPFDVRQSGFTGAGINAVTRSGTNEFTGSVFYNLQNENFVGTRARTNEVVTNNFVNKQVGFRLGGPIIRNKLFFFVNGEQERRNEPATTFRANQGGEPVGGNVTRVQAADLNALSSYLRTNFGYETGPYEGYDNERSSVKFLAKMDWNISTRHKASLRYNMLDSETDLLTSNSSSLGFGSRRTNLNALNYRNSNYIQTEKIQSVIGELNSIFGRFSNNLIMGYTYQNEDRKSRGQFFPLIEIQQGGTNYITAGFEPFTPNNRLDYSTLQLQDNFTFYAGRHTLTAGLNVERFSFTNVFFPGSQGVYVYNSLQDFYEAADAYLDNPNLTESPVTLRQYELRYSALPGGAEPVQPTKVTYGGVYLQDNWQVLPNLNLTGGIRLDVPFFEETGIFNPRVPGLAFQDPANNPLRVSTAQLPDPKPLWSPRLGFNWDVLNERSLQVRGGTGIFTGRPAFVWISNQIGNNGMLTGFLRTQNTTAFPFDPNPARHIPANPSAPATFEINVTDPNFRFPQIWRSNIAVDKSLFAGLVGTLEFIYGQTINGVQYWDINQAGPAGTFPGNDNRPQYPGLGLRGDALNEAIRINPNIAGAYYLTNTNQGYSYSITAQLERPYSNGLFARIAYNFGVAKDLMSAGSIASGSYRGVATVRGNNYPELAFSDNDQRHRVIGSISYRKEYGGFGATQISIFSEARTIGRFTYTYAQDMNGDGITGNDLVYVPNNASEVAFAPITIGSGPDRRTLFTPEQQQAALDAFIQQDEYLRSRRGQYTERNGGMLPWVFNTDLSIVQEFFVNVGGKRNTLQLRGDLLNAGNFLNSDWGVGTRVTQTTPLVSAGTTAAGIPLFRMQTIGSGENQRLLSESFQPTSGINDVWRAQIGIRYIFN